MSFASFGSTASNASNAYNSSKAYLTRAQTRTLGLEHPIGDPFGGAAYGEYNDPISAAISVGGNLLGGMMQSDSAEDAANIQAASGDRAIAEQARQYNQTRTDFAPYRDTGSDAVLRIRDLLGLGTPSGSSDFGSLNRRFTVSDFLNDPVTQLSLDYGRKGIERNLGAMGMRKSGLMLKGLQDYAGTRAAESSSRFYGDQDRIFNRLSGVAGTGQSATNSVAGAGQNSANNIGNIMTGVGNARGAASIAQGNAWGNAFGNIGQAWNQRSTLDQILNRGGAAGQSNADLASMYNF